MTQYLVNVTYDLTIPGDTFLERAPEAAEAIAGVPGLVWKIWGFDAATGRGTSSYLFRDRASAEAFEAGPMLNALRVGPTSRVDVRLAPVDRALSLTTGAAQALSQVAEAA